MGIEIRRIVGRKEVHHGISRWHRGPRLQISALMMVSSLLIVLSFGLLFLGAELLVRGGASMALKLGMSALVVGLTVVAYGTSMPEFVVSIKAAYEGQPGIAIGNVVGSNIFNIAVNLALAAVVFPIITHPDILKRDLPILLGATLLVPLTFLGHQFTFEDGEISRGEGALLLGGAIIYTWWMVKSTRGDNHSTVESLAEVPEVKKTGSLAADIGLILAGLGLLVLGSRLLVDHSVIIATSLGVSEAVIGLTIVAAGTSMPELATTIVAAFRKHSDIALGNVVGSNLFNLLFVLGGSAAIHPIKTSGLKLIDLWVMIGVTAILLPMLLTGRRLSRLEGALLVLGYAGYLALMWPKG